jgi:hypothetical protein
MSKPIQYYLSRNSVIDLQSIEDLNCEDKVSLASLLIILVNLNRLPIPIKTKEVTAEKAARLAKCPTNEIEMLLPNEKLKLAAAILMAASDETDSHHSTYPPPEVIDAELIS